MLLTQPVCQRLGLLALISRKHMLVELETALRAAGTPWSYFTGSTGTFLVQNKSTNTDGNGGTFFFPPLKKKVEREDFTTAAAVRDDLRHLLMHRDLKKMQARA
jgi:hypothetical protein